MNITELDEWQGITADMVREWLKRTGWELRTDEWGEKRWFNGNGRSIADKRVLVTDGFRWIASQSVQTVQALLREINPRMRKGMPSEAAREACASWLVRDVETGEVELHRTEGAALYSASDYKSGTLKTEAVPLRDFGDWMEFWPCDANGNKTRWPTDAEGNML